MQRGITIIGLVIVVLILFGIMGVILSKSGIIDGGKFFGNKGLGQVVPIPEKQDVEDVGRRGVGVITGGSFDFDEDTPGYANFKDLNSGGVPRDGIPSVDDPAFESVQSASSWMNDDDVLFVLEYKDEVRGYPQKILNRHEIVNDVVSEDPLVITFCPLCGSSLAFDRRVGGQTLEFGVSGLLHNNDLVMYDRETETLWQQITGEAIVGELFGERLKQIPLSGMRWMNYVQKFPNSEVLSRPGRFGNYDSYPYGDYESDPNPLFPMEKVDNTIHPKTVVYGVELGDGLYKAYQEEDIQSEGNIEDEVGGVKLKITYNDGDVSVKRLDTSEEIPATRLFWFAWKAFRPETELY